MVKTMTINEVMMIAPDFLTLWNEESTNIRVGGKALFNVVKLKKAFEEQFRSIQETVQTIMEQHGGEPNENGQGIAIKDPESAAKANEALSELGEQKVDIVYGIIQITEKDNLPPKLMDLLFDFIEFKE